VSAFPSGWTVTLFWRRREGKRTPPNCFLFPKKVPLPTASFVTSAQISPFHTHEKTTTAAAASPFASKQVKVKYSTRAQTVFLACFQRENLPLFPPDIERYLRASTKLLSRGEARNNREMTRLEEARLKKTLALAEGAH